MRFSPGAEAASHRRTVRPGRLSKCFSFRKMAGQNEKLSISELKKKLLGKGVDISACIERADLEALQLGCISRDVSCAKPICSHLAPDKGEVGQSTREQR